MLGPSTRWPKLQTRPKIPNPTSSNNVTDTLNPPLFEKEQEIFKQILGLQLDSKFDLEPSKTPKKTTTNYSI